MKKESQLGAGIAIGCGIGAVLGIVTGNQGLWISVGIAVGAGIGGALSKQRKKNDNESSIETKQKKFGE